MIAPRTAPTQSPAVIVGYQSDSGTVRRASAHPSRSVTTATVAPRTVRRGGRSSLFRRRRIRRWYRGTTGAELVDARSRPRVPAAVHVGQREREPLVLV